MVLHGADMYQCDPNKLNMLHMAAQGDSAGACVYLIERGFDPDCQDSQGMTPLHHAAYHGCEVVSLYLVSLGA